MTLSEKLRATAAAARAGTPPNPDALDAIALGVRRFEHALDEIAADAMEDEQLRATALRSPGVVVPMLRAWNGPVLRRVEGETP